MFSTMTDRNKFLYLLTNQSVSKIVAQFVVDAFEDIKCNMYILHHITCKWAKSTLCVGLSQISNS